MDSYLDCRAHEVTFLPPTIAKFFGYNIQDVQVSIVMENEWPATEVGSCAFSCEVSAPVTLESSSHVAQSSRASATSFRLLSSVDVLNLPGLGSFSMLMQPPQKQLAQETLVQSTVNSPQTSLKALSVSVGFCTSSFNPRLS